VVDAKKEPTVAERLDAVVKELRKNKADDVADMVEQRVLHVIYDAEGRVPALAQNKSS